MMDRRRSSRERRGGERAPLVAAVRQRVGGDVQLALTQNVSETGVRLKRVRGRALLPRTPMTVSFELPDGGGVLSVRGAVVFERAEGAYQATGVRFEDLSPLDYARIARFVRRSINRV
jgi:hypothetical protein